jgi:hypothetical protein
MLDTDAFMCHFPPSFCEIYLPFNRSVIISASHRLFLGRCSIPQSSHLVKHLRAMSTHPRRHFIFGSNTYDAEYIGYYTGLVVPVLPASSYGYQFIAYAPTKTEILVGPVHLSTHTHIEDINAVGKGWNFVAIREKYKRFDAQVCLDWADSAAGCAINIYQ